MPSNKKLIKRLISALDENRKSKRHHRRRSRKSKSRSRSRSPQQRSLSIASTSYTPDDPKSRTSSPDHRLEVNPEPSINPNPDITEMETPNPYKEALGMDYKEPQPYMGQIHKDIRFNHILTKGLTKEERETITKKHAVPDNCTLLDAPLLNPEVKAVLTEASKLRDYGIEMSQKQLGLATSIIAKTMTDVIVTEEIDKHKLLTNLADATKILTNIHYNQTQTRIKLIYPLLDKNFNQILSKTTRDTFLYGENLPDLLRNVKQMQQAAAQLKRPPPVVPSNNRSNTNNVQRPSQGNRNGPPQKPKMNARGGPRKTTQPTSQRQPRWQHHSERATHQQGRYRNAPTKR